MLAHGAQHGKGSIGGLGFLLGGVLVTLALAASEIATKRSASPPPTIPPEANRTHEAFMQLLGQWLSEDEQEIMEFFADGTIRIVNSSADFYEVGAWRFPVPHTDRLRIDLGSYYPGVDYLDTRFTLADNQLELQIADAVMRYQRHHPK
ncbi:MAG: hypothetical protein COT71_01975 [Candidatus Andersenbacteria bacterium CG10_big_fil_rev_8_21_14_0_10_54_11]|uniref:Uncharacterized protein n=1 Tax=Candidatus Andersenbacteria bacterium CG10_big_fil_rev_8_21_14_0_10_54_11 TaxID=1974485 RepID=A0A2M6WZN6_9BACT|nr:MAG: hypothetical protein COT71_01975 [Candidatus Andersenbacteria bacterium CG10_big_fil_rev_8_21_14_0_10_54_11]